MDKQPRTPLERQMRDEVRQVREDETKEALAGIREGYRQARRGTMQRMDAYRNRVVSRTNRLLQQKEAEIARDEKREENQGKVDSESHPHEKNHGMSDFRRELIDMISSERTKEKNHVNRDMDAGDRMDYQRAKNGMDSNQRKDERQVVDMTRRLMAQRRKSFFSEAIYPMESGVLLKAEQELREKPRTTHASVRIEFPKKKRDFKDFSEHTLEDLQSHPAWKLLSDPIDDTHKPLSKDKTHHVANVSATMGRMALLNPELGLDPDAAWLAGAVHDMFDDSPLRNRGTDESRKANPRWFWITGHDHHGPLAAARAFHEKLLGPDWIDAIRHHSTGKHGMTPHMKVMLLSDSISPDRGKSDELKKLRSTAFSDPDEAVRMLINALHHSVLRGHGQNKLRNGVPYDPFRPHVAMMRMYRVLGPDGKPSSKHPDSLASMSGLSPKDIESPFGMGFKSVLDLDNDTVQHVLQSAFHQIDSADDKNKPEALATWLTARNRGGALFRNMLPGIWPLIAPKYGNLIKEAEKRSDGQSDVTMPDIGAISKLIGSGHRSSIEHMLHHIHPDWVNGKPGARMFIRIRILKPLFSMPAREMHKSMMNIEHLLPESLQVPTNTDWHLGNRAL